MAEEQSVPDTNSLTAALVASVPQQQPNPEPHMTPSPCGSIATGLCIGCKNCGDPPAAKLCQAAVFSSTTAMSDTFLESWYTSLVELPLGPLTKQPCRRWHTASEM